MNYRKQVDPELRKIAKKIPYNQAIIKCANIFLAIAFKLTKVPKEVIHRNMIMEGYRGLKFKTDVFEPNVKGKLPCLIYVHGGAFSYKASVYHKKLACLYAVRAGCRVYFPDYHLTPKYPYPAAYEDVLALYKHIMEKSEEYQIDKEKMGIAGDSAGASIAALICNNYEREGLQRPCVQMLVYPVAEADGQTASMKKFSDTPMWNAKNNRSMWLYYLGNLKAEAAHEASPMHSRFPQRIPDTYIETAEYDCLHDEGVIYGKRLREAGAYVEINETKGTIHGYDSVLNSQAAVRNIEKRISFIKKRFK
jgi:acetyl esterase